MKVDSLDINGVFSGGGRIHYVLPHFQREYAWEKNNWKTLLDDINEIYNIYDPEKLETKPEHFMGALVVIAAGNRDGVIPAFRLVDGQQRLTTISLLLCALGRLVEQTHPDLFEDIWSLLVNGRKTGLLAYKLVPTTKSGDQDTYFALLSGESIPENTSRINEAYEFFYKQLRLPIINGKYEPRRLFSVIATCLQMVFITIEQRERPYEIFESLNYKGKPLTQPDLVRNYIAMRLPETDQEDLFKKYWVDVEETLDEDRNVRGIGELTGFLRHYIAYRMKNLPNIGHVYARFRDRMESEFRDYKTFIGELEALHRFAHYYNRLLRPANEPDNDIRNALARLNVFEASTAYPFLMAVYEYYNQGRINKAELLKGMQILENYMIRRFLAELQTNYTNKMFPALSNEIELSRFSDSLRRALITKNYPNDNRIRDALLSQPLYDRQRQQRLVFILEMINRHLSEGSGGYTVLDDKPTIEHIMPQTLNKTWEIQLGENRGEIHRDYLHTLGNLTLVTQEWNASLSNAYFDVKLQKLQNHALLINSLYFKDAEVRWDNETIVARTTALTDVILQLWESLGEPPTTTDIRGQKPRILRFRGENYEVHSWRDVVWRMTECVIENLGNGQHFEHIVRDISWYSREDGQRRKQLSNGWYLYISLSAQSVMSVCERLANAAGLEADMWEIELAIPDKASDNELSKDDEVPF